MKRNTPSAKSSSSSGSPPEEVYLNNDLLRKTQCKDNQAQTHLQHWAMSSIEEALHQHSTKLEEALYWNKQLLSNIRGDKTLIEDPHELFSQMRFAAKECVKSVKDSEETFFQLLQQEKERQEQFKPEKKKKKKKKKEEEKAAWRRKKDKGKRPKYF